MNNGIFKIPNDSIHVDQFAGVIPNGEYMMKIYCKDMELGKQFKDLILNHQAIVEKVRELTKQHITVDMVWFNELKNILENTDHSNGLGDKS